MLIELEVLKTAQQDPDLECSALLVVQGGGLGVCQDLNFICVQFQEVGNQSEIGVRQHCRESRLQGFSGVDETYNRKSLA